MEEIYPGQLLMMEQEEKMIQEIIGDQLQDIQEIETITKDMEKSNRSLLRKVQRTQNAPGETPEARTLLCFQDYHRQMIPLEQQNRSRPDQFGMREHLQKSDQQRNAQGRLHSRSNSEFESREVRSVSGRRTQVALRLDCLKRKESPQSSTCTSESKREKVTNSALAALEPKLRHMSLHEKCSSNPRPSTQMKTVHAGSGIDGTSRTAVHTAKCHLETARKVHSATTSLDVDKMQVDVTTPEKEAFNDKESVAGSKKSQVQIQVEEYTHSAVKTPQFGCRTQEMYEVSGVELAVEHLMDGKSTLSGIATRSAKHLAQSYAEYKTAEVARERVAKEAARPPHHGERMQAQLLQQRRRAQAARSKISEYLQEDHDKTDSDELPTGPPPSPEPTFTLPCRMMINGRLMEEANKNFGVEYRKWHRNFDQFGQYAEEERKEWSQINGLDDEEWESLSMVGEEELHVEDYWTLL